MSDEHWRPAATIDVLRSRSAALAKIRAFFADRGVLEVETPLLCQAGVLDPNLSSMKVSLQSGIRYLHTSPEFCMKRLLAAGSGDIFQVCKVFRAGEQGPYHNPEFSLLEWYRVGFDHWRLMDEVDALILNLTEGRVSLGAPQRVSYGSLFQRVLGLDPHGATHEELARAAEAAGIHPRDTLARDENLDLLFAEAVTPILSTDRLTYVYDFPATQASLAIVRGDEVPVAERFEVLWGAMELANGFHELTDAQEHRARFARDQKARLERGLEPMRADERLLSALDHGLPACAGVALGLDRLLMMITGVDHIRDALSFDWNVA